MLSDQDKQALAAAASTFWERLSGDYEPVRADDPQVRQYAEAVLDAWRSTATDGAADLFARRLSVYGATEESVRPYLGAVKLKDGAALPAHIAAWDWIGPAIAAAPACAPPVDDDGQPIPFADLFQPLVEAAIARAAERAATDDLPETARVAFARALHNRLHEVSGPSLFESFNSYREALGVPTDGSWTGGEAPGCKHYDGFVSAMRDGVFRNLVMHRPVLARLIAQVTEAFIAGTAEFFDRLAADRVALAEAFGVTGALTSLAPAGDPHDGGRMVSILTFENGVKLVYKPRPLAIDRAWVGLLDWLKERDRAAYPVLDMLPAAPAVLDRGDYGWAAFIESHVPEGDDAGRRYAAHAGAMLGLLHLLCGSDMHGENVLIEHGRPVPVDLETILTPRLKSRRLGHAGDVFSAAGERLGDTVMTVGFLPVWMSLPGGKAVAAGALAGPELPSLKNRVPARINTDAMHFVMSEVAGGLDGSSKVPEDTIVHAEALIETFTAMCGCLDEHVVDMAAPGGPLSAFRGVPIRFVLRATNLYANLLTRANRPHYLEDGARWSASFDFLSRTADWSGEDPLVPVRERELIWLSRYDVPKFSCLSDGMDLLDRDGIAAESVVETSAFDRLTARLKDLSGPALDFQTAVIRTVMPGPPHFESTDWPDAPPLSRELAVARATAIADELEAASVTDAGGRTWFGMIPGNDERFRNLEVSDYGLYSGNIGIALFFAALFRETGHPDHERLARETLRPVAETIADPVVAATLSRRTGIGGMSGMGSLVYGFTQISRLLNDPSLLESARQAAQTVNERRAANDNDLDIIGGSAGAILALLAFYAHTGNAAALASARFCGERLLQKQRPDGGWKPSAFDTPLLGMSHGASGIALALGRLAEASGDMRFAEGMARGLGFERMQYRPKRRNWPDLREDKIGFPCQWCHGATGIGLARALLPPSLRDDIAIEEAHVAMETTLGNKRISIDHMCCGNLGKADALMTCGQILNRADFCEAALTRAGAIASAPAFALDGQPGLPAAALFQGLAGCGYTLLRLTAKTPLPNVLALAP